MYSISAVLFFLLSTTGVMISEPADGGTYSGDWLTLRAVVENENQVPDSVVFTLNGQSPDLIPRLNTDWPTFMGNQLHTGFSRSPAPADNSVLWTAQIGENGNHYATPVVADGIVYYPAVGDCDSLHALDAATGELLWKYCTNVSNWTVSVKYGNVYVVSDSLRCLDATTGELIWRSRNATSSGRTPAVADGFVYAGTSGTQNSSVCCIDAFTGEKLWHKVFPGRISSSMTICDDRLIVPTWLSGTASPLYAISRENGDILWQNTDSEEGYAVSSAAVSEGLLYIGGWDGWLRAMDILTGETVWENQHSPVNEPGIFATAAIDQGRVYIGDNIVPGYKGKLFPIYHCINAVDGNPVWEVSGNQVGSSCLADGMVLFGEGYNETAARVIALDQETGAEIWSFATDSPAIFSSPSLTDGVLYIAGMDNTLYAFGTGLMYTYLDDLFAETGENQLIVTSWMDGVPAAADTVSFTVTGTGMASDVTPGVQIRPGSNPFYCQVDISFSLQEEGVTSVHVFDVSGRIIRTLVDRELLSEGVHSIHWNGLDSGDALVSAGIYLCRVEHGAHVGTTGICMLR